MKSPYIRNAALLIALICVFFMSCAAEDGAASAYPELSSDIYSEAARSDLPADCDDPLSWTAEQVMELMAGFITERATLERTEAMSADFARWVENATYTESPFFMSRTVDLAYSSMEGPEPWSSAFLVEFTVLESAHPSLPVGKQSWVFLVGAGEGNDFPIVTAMYPKEKYDNMLEAMAQPEYACASWANIFFCGDPGEPSLAGIDETILYLTAIDGEIGLKDGVSAFTDSELVSAADRHLSGITAERAQSQYYSAATGLYSVAAAGYPEPERVITGCSRDGESITFFCGAPPLVRSRGRCPVAGVRHKRQNSKATLLRQGVSLNRGGRCRKKKRRLTVPLPIRQAAALFICAISRRSRITHTAKAIFPGRRPSPRLSPCTRRNSGPALFDAGAFFKRK